MLNIEDQKEIIIDRLASAMNRAINLAKFSRSLKLYDKAAKYYAISAAYKRSLSIIKLLEDKPNGLTFESYPQIKTL